MRELEARQGLPPQPAAPRMSPNSKAQLSLFFNDLSDDDDEECETEDFGGNIVVSTQTANVDLAHRDSSGPIDIFSVDISDDSDSDSDAKKVAPPPSLRHDRDVLCGLYNGSEPDRIEGDTDDFNCDNTHAHSAQRVLTMDDIFNVPLSDDEDEDRILTIDDILNMPVSDDEDEDESELFAAANKRFHEDAAKASIPAAWGEISDDEEDLANVCNDVTPIITDAGADAGADAGGGIDGILGRQSKPGSDIPGAAHEERGRILSEEEVARAAIPFVWGEMSDDEEGVASVLSSIKEE
jgi:hypothetical protein